MPAEQVSPQLSWQKKSEIYRGQKIRVVGGFPLSGVIDNVGGDKTTASKPLIAACICDLPSEIRNVPNIGEIDIVADMLASLGVDLAFSLDQRQINVYPQNMRYRAIPGELGKPSRTSMLMAGVMLSRFGKAEIPFPEGDRIGDRPVDGQIRGLVALGAEVEEQDSEHLVFVAPRGLKGSEFTFPKPTHTGAENLIIASAKAPGETRLHNTSLAPEIDHGVIEAFNIAGAKIVRQQDPDGNKLRDIEVNGVEYLKGLDYELQLDPNAVITYAVAALITESQKGVFIKGADPEPIDSFLKLIDRMGGGYDIQNDGINFYYEKPLKAPHQTLITGDTPIDTEKYLRIKSDWQPLISALLLKASGTSRIIEAYFSNRFHHLFLAKEAGAKIEFFDPRLEDPTIRYNFNEDDNLHGVKIYGGNALQSIAEMNAGNDIRLGAFSLLLSLMTSGNSIIHDLSQIKRGYDDLIENFKNIGAQIT
jgi:UDP-N-acetylglucosamine 1-carboxyvinyltransferase